MATHWYHEANYDFELKYNLGFIGDNEEEKKLNGRVLISVHETTENPCVASSILARTSIKNVNKPYKGLFLLINFLNTTIKPNHKVFTLATLKTEQNK